MSGEILPPRESITTDDGNITQPWYRYLVSRKRITDGVSAASVVTFGDASTVFPSARSLAVASGELTETDGGEGRDLTIGLADSGVTANTYGEPTRILVLAIDAKGRVTNAQEIKLDVSDVDGILKTANGGTGFASYAIGDLVYADTTTTFAKLPDVAIGNVLKAGGVGAAPAYGKVVLTTDVSGVLPPANGGTGGGFSGGPALYTSLTFVNGICTAAS